MGPSRGLFIVIGMGMCSLGLGTAHARGAPRVGDAFDAAPFGYELVGEPGKEYGIRWAEPRKIRQVVVEFDEEVLLPSPGSVRLEYWHAAWDGRPEPVAAEQGAGGVGWDRMDDWTNGQWRVADAELLQAGRRWTFSFAPTGAKEFPQVKDGGVGYRKTLKIRMVSSVPLPKPVRMAALTDAIYQPLTVRVFFGKPASAGISVGEAETGRMEMFNGCVVRVRPIGTARIDDTAKFAWTMPALGGAGIEVDILMAVDKVDPQFDAPVVTVRSQDRPFSFAPDEVARGERILVDDLGVLAVRADDPITLEGYRERRKEFAGKSVYDRVRDEKEQSLSRAWKDMPLKRPLYFVHGLPGNRNSMHQEPGGDIEITSHQRWFTLPTSEKDTARKGWSGDAIKFGFQLPQDHRIARRSLKEGYLPLLTTWAQEGPVVYEQATILDKLDGDLSNVALDDPTVLLVRLRVLNTSKTDEGTARLYLASWPREGSDRLTLMNTRAFAVKQDKSLLRYVVRGLDRGKVASEGDGLRWTLDLKPGETHELFFAMPSITLDKEEEIAPLEKRDFEADAARICKYWEEITNRGSVVDTPEPWLDDFYKAHARHLLVNCFKEIGSDRLHAHVGTFYYGDYPDESVMMISDLDRRGYHDEAQRCYESYLHAQGTVPLPGTYKSSEGVFYGSGGHETGGYNKNHGWVLWGMGEHWWYTRDRKWMERAAPHLVAGCDWVIRERKNTMTTNPDGSRPIEYGFLPAGSLEDVTDYWFWLSTNACTVWGFRNLADALADFGHPEAGRLQAEAKAMYEDVMRGFNESRVRCPVVRLRDGTYVPHYPSRLYERGRTHGWLRETLEGAMHLLITDLVDPASPQAEWILKDFEDNLYISDRYGYDIPNFNTFWFSRGGFSMQANLLGGPLPYLYRDDIKYFLRAYFNGFASAFYPDIRMCNEHSLPELGYPAGDHFKSSDEAQSNYWLRLMFVHERGNQLYLGQAIPRAWLNNGQAVGIERAASHFGTVSFRLIPAADGSAIKAELDLPQGGPRPEHVYVRLRHPQERPIKSVTVNGQDHADFDPAREWVVLPGAISGRVEVVARY